MQELEFIEILRNSNISDESINFILSKKSSKRILKREKDDLILLIKLLKKYDIDIRKCLTVLAYGKAKEIEKIIKLLKEENIDVRECLSVLAYGKAEEIEKIIKLLKE
ncbi:MAG: hypothetical protein Q4E39_05985, partial [bacterium]|nr:hypothetical protein [bacterium]